MPATGRVTATSLNLRDGPNGNVLDVLPSGAVVQVIEDFGDGWPLVTATVGATSEVGFVDSRYISWDPTGDPAPPPGPDRPAPIADPAWVYAQSTGRMFHLVGGVATLLSRGYSGNGDAENDPNQQCLTGHGPLPRARYSIGPPIDFKKMHNCLSLTPLEPEKMCGRSGFLIHDGNFSRHGDTSEGCICLAESARLQIATSGDSVLQVARDDPA
ncbi:MAG TPA: tlde1 domain-containing protein [Roseiarcus sp.]|nr:tlde1 domain-containing protein [Roseiarcus sp.]